MSTNLLSPACETCHNCCSPCGDYYAPNVWYARFCTIVPQYMGYPNRRGPASTTFAYWATNSLAADIASLLVSWQFDGSQPTVFSTHRRYDSPAIAIPALEQTLEYHTGAGVDFVTENPVRSILMKNWTARIAVIDKCGIWTSRMELSCDVFEGAAQFYSPNAAGSFPYFYGGAAAVSSVISTCGNEYTSGLGGAFDLRTAAGFGAEVLPSPVKPTTGNYPYVLYRTQANNAMLSC